MNELIITENPRMPATARYSARDAAGEAIGIGATPEEAEADWHRAIEMPEPEEEDTP